MDALGFNAIDFMGFDFWPTGERFWPRRRRPHGVSALHVNWPPTIACRFGAGRRHQRSISQPAVATRPSFADRRVFPLPFILRHYPIRGQEHGERKVFQERRNRFLERERDRGWHVQYDQVSDGASFLKDAATLTAFDGDIARIALSLRAVETLDLRIKASEAEVARLAGEIARRDIEFAAKDAEIERRGDEIARGTPNWPRRPRRRT